MSWASKNKKQSEFSSICEYRLDNYNKLSRIVLHTKSGFTALADFGRSTFITTNKKVLLNNVKYILRLYVALNDLT